MLFVILFPFFSYIFLLVAIHIFQFQFSMFANVKGLSFIMASSYIGVMTLSHWFLDAIALSVPSLPGFPLPLTPTSALSLPIFITPFASHLP